MRIMRQLCFKENEFAQDTVCGLVDAEWPERTESNNEKKERPETSTDGKKYVYIYYCLDSSFSFHHYRKASEFGGS